MLTKEAIARTHAVSGCPGEYEHMCLELKWYITTDISPKKRHTNGQYMYEKMFDFISNLKSTIQSHNEVQIHTH